MKIVRIEYYNRPFNESEVSKDFFVGDRKAINEKMLELWDLTLAYSRRDILPLDLVDIERGGFLFVNLGGYNTCLYCVVK